MPRLADLAGKQLLRIVSPSDAASGLVMDLDEGASPRPPAPPLLHDAIEVEVRSPDEAPWRLRLKAPARLTIGRSTTSDICLADARVSSHHACLEVRGDLCSITDLGSSNGTFRRSERLSGTVALCDGDAVDIGGCRLTFTHAR